MDEEAENLDFPQFVAGLIERHRQGSKGKRQRHWTGRLFSIDWKRQELRRRSSGGRVENSQALNQHSLERRSVLRSSQSEKDPSRDQRLRSPARALLVLDQRVLADLVSLALNHGHYIIRVASTGQEATSAVADWSPHLVVLDMDIEGSEMLKRFATATLEGGRLPVIALTRRSDLKSKLAAFAQGVDDILTVPFSSEELVARVVAVLRRTYRDAAVFSPLLRLGALEIDILNRRVCAGGTELHLTSLEQSLLYYNRVDAELEPSVGLSALIFLRLVAFLDALFQFGFRSRVEALYDKQMELSGRSFDKLVVRYAHNPGPQPDGTAGAARAVRPQAFCAMRSRSSHTRVQRDPVLRRNRRIGGTSWAGPFPPAHERSD